MTDILSMTYRELYPETSPDEIRKRFRKLASEWHPDHNTDANAALVFQYIRDMRDRALTGGPSVVFTRANGTSFKMSYLRETQGQGYRVYTGLSRIAYLVGKQYANSVRNHKWTFTNQSIRAEMEPILPQWVRTEELNDGSVLFIYDRSGILMSDLLALHVIPNEHVAWMISRMINLACYLEFEKISHAGLSPDCLMVNLEKHSVSIVGPPIFLTRFGKRPVSVPARTIGSCNWLKKKEEVANFKIDVSLVKETALNLFRDSGVTLGQKGVRKEITKWLLTPPTGSAIQEHEAWDRSLGERKFIPYPISAEQLIEKLKE